MTGKILVTAALAALISTIAPARAAPPPPTEEQQWVGQGALVRQDFADCKNTGVTPDPARVGGMVKVLRRQDGKTFVEVAYTKGAPNTNYNVFQKCVTKLGVVRTDGQGKGFKAFRIANTTADAVLTFDSYPDGAPAGNKYQSVQIHLTALPPSIHPH